MSAMLPKAVFVGFWLCALLAALLIAGRYSTATQFFGIADDQEQTVRFTAAVEVVAINFVSGQEIRLGDVVLQVRQPDLEAQLKIIDEQVQGLQFSTRENVAGLSAQIVELTAALRVRRADSDTRIRNLQARRASAQALYAGTKEFGGAAAIQQEIASLRTSQQADAHAVETRINSLQSMLAVGTRPIDAELAELDRRRQELVRRNAALTVAANLSGRVGSIFFKVGDTVPPYQPLLTIHGSRPTFVKGYIHENVSNELHHKDRVWVSAVSSHQSGTYSGVVESLGTRIVEFPARLKVNPLAQAWGREVIVRLEEEHGFLLGEKVTVHAGQPFNLLAEVQDSLRLSGAAFASEKQEEEALSREPFARDAFTRDTIVRETKRQEVSTGELKREIQ